MKPIVQDDAQTHNKIKPWHKDSGNQTGTGQAKEIPFHQAGGDRGTKPSPCVRYDTAEPAPPESLKSALSLGQRSLQPSLPFVGSRRGGKKGDILSSPSVNRNTDSLCISLLPFSNESWVILQKCRGQAVFKEFQQSDSCCWQKCSVHLRREILGLVVCPRAGEGHREGWGAELCHGARLCCRDQPTLSPVRGLSNVQKAC